MNVSRAFYQNVSFGASSGGGTSAGEGKVLVSSLLSAWFVFFVFSYYFYSLENLIRPPFFLEMKTMHVPYGKRKGQIRRKRHTLESTSASS